MAKDARELKNRIKIYKITEIEDEDIGTNEPMPVLLRAAWADIQPRTGSLLAGREAGTMLSKTTHLIEVRSRVIFDMDNACYIEWIDGFKTLHKFEIDYILPPAGEKFAKIYCQEVI